MITRAQAEALLTLAESLEACAALDILVQEDSDGVSIIISGEPYYPESYCRIDGMALRLAVNALIPKQET